MRLLVLTILTCVVATEHLIQKDNGLLKPKPVVHVLNFESTRTKLTNNRSLSQTGSQNEFKVESAFTEVSLGTAERGRRYALNSLFLSSTTHVQQGKDIRLYNYCIHINHECQNVYLKIQGTSSSTNGGVEPMILQSPMTIRTSDTSHQQRILKKTDYGKMTLEKRTGGADCERIDTTIPGAAAFVVVVIVIVLFQLKTTFCSTSRVGFPSAHKCESFQAADHEDILETLTRPTDISAGVYSYDLVRPTITKSFCSIVVLVR